MSSQTLEPPGAQLVLTYYTVEFGFICHQYDSFTHQINVYQASYQLLGIVLVTATTVLGSESPSAGNPWWEKSIKESHKQMWNYNSKESCLAHSAGGHLSCVCSSSRVLPLPMTSPFTHRPEESPGSQHGSSHNWHPSPLSQPAALALCLCLALVRWQWNECSQAGCLPP